MPDLGEGLEEGEIVSWLVAEGQDVELNQPLVEIETAKATVEIPSPFAGTIAALHAGAGDTVAVGAPLVTFGVAGGDGSPAPPSQPAPSSEAPARPATPVDRGTGRPVAATPAVRKLAKDLGVDLAEVEGTGPDGRVTAGDVQRSAAGTTVEGTDGDGERIPLTPVRRAVAARLERSASIPQVTTFRTLDATALDRIRRDLEVSPLPVFLAALCRTIAAHPILNASWEGHAIVTHRAIHAGVAVDTERGLLVPVVRDAGSRGIGALASEIGRLAQAARAGTLGPPDLSGATISVTNTGSYGSEAGTPLLNPPGAVTIALGVIAPRALVSEGGALEARPGCTISLTFDHRVLDGAAAGRALTDLVTRLADLDALRELPR
jgi:2-oxoisovalerate dehydrogenase E2 component (dihydrolipoyl transacylase)